MICTKNLEMLRIENGDNIAVWGLTFKQNKFDVIKSPALKILIRLTKEGYIMTQRQ
jgi:UDP-glucose 6-dehydrogenase